MLIFYIAEMHSFIDFSVAWGIILACPAESERLASGLGIFFPSGLKSLFLGRSTFVRRIVEYAFFCAFGAGRAPRQREPDLGYLHIFRFRVSFWK